MDFDVSGFARSFAREFKDNRLGLIAAGVAFYGLIAIFPTLLALVSLFGLFLDPSALGQLLSDLQDIMPAEAYALINAELTRLTQQGRSQLGWATLVSLLVALWGAGNGMRAMMSALNVAYGEQEDRSFLRLHWTSLVLTLAGLAMGVLMLISLVMLPLALTLFDWIPWIESILGFLRWPIMGGFLFFALAGLYRFGADRSQRPSRWWPDWGALLALGLWLAGSVGLSLYVSKIASYSATYQSLSAVIILMLWLWMSALVVLVGASVNAQIEKAKT